MEKQIIIRRFLSLLTIVAMVGMLLLPIGDTAQANTSSFYATADNWYATEKASIAGMAYGNGQYVLIANDNVTANTNTGAGVFTSTDKSNWTYHSLDSTVKMNDIIFENNKFVAVGGKGPWSALGRTGTIYTSIDGVTWENRVIPNEKEFSRIVYINGEYIALTNGAYYVSQDLVTWTKRLVQNINALFGDLIYVNGMYIMTGGNKLYTSTDLQSWTVRDVGNDAAGGITNIVSIGDDEFIANARTKLLKLKIDEDTISSISIDMSAANLSIPRYLSTIAYDGEDSIIIGGTFGYGWSNDKGVTWNFKTDNADNLSGATFINNEIFGWYGISTTDSYLRTSTDGGASWQELFLISNEANGINTAIHYNDQYLFFGARSSILTNDVSSRVSMKLPIDQSSFGQSPFIGAAKDENLFVAVTKNGIVATSEDGLSWSKTGQVHGQFNNMVYGNGRFVAVGDYGLVATSNDGLTWDQLPSLTISNIRDVIFDGEKFFAVAGKDILKSTDGLEWTNTTLGNASSLSRLEYDIGLYMVLGRSNNVGAPQGIWISSDGDNWNLMTLAGLQGEELVDIAYGNGFIVGALRSGKVAVSLDGRTWNVADRQLFVANQNSYFTHIEFMNDTFLAFQNNGMVLKYHMLELSYHSADHTSGAVPSSSKVYESIPIVLKDNSGQLTRDGYRFAGWNVELDGWTSTYQPGELFTMPAHNVEVTANWEKGISVSYESNGATSGTVPQTVYTVENSPITVSDNTGSLAKTGYRFIGWNTEANGSGTRYAPNATLQTGTENITLYAEWEKLSYTVSFDTKASDVIVPNQTVEYEGMATKPTDPVREHYVFGGWYTDEAMHNLYDFDSAVTSDMTLHAAWTANQYTVNYVSSDETSGVVPDPQSSAYGNSIVVEGAGSLARTGYIFAGWNTKPDGTGTSYPAGAALLLSEDISLYAQWSLLVYVTYDANGATTGTVPEGGAYESGSSVTVAVYGNTGGLDRLGHVFQGWNTLSDGNGIGYKEGDTIEIGMENITLFAHWERLNYEVTFHSNGGTTVERQSVPYGDYILEPTAPEMMGYTFSGWYTDIHLQQLYSFKTPITDNITLYAKWDKRSYTLTYDGNGFDGGTVPAAVTQDFGTDITVSGNTGELVKRGYTFTGWNTKADGSGIDYAVGSLFSLGNSDVILYAKWKVNSSGGTGGGGGAGGGSGGDDNGSGKKSGSGSDESEQPAAPGQPSSKRITLSDKFDPERIQSVIARGQSAPAISFIDVPSQLWSASTINRSAQMGIVNGYEDGSFNPDRHVTRAEFTKMIAELLGLSPESRSEFADVQDHWAESAIAAMQQVGIINGYSDGLFRPDQHITRAEIVAILAHLTNYAPATKALFTDIDSSWASTEINAFAEAGIVSGKREGFFEPNAFATRAEAVTMLVRLLDYLSE